MLNYPICYTLKHTHIFSLSETHINNSTPTQLLKFRGTPSLTKTDVGTHGDVAVYIKDCKPFIKRTDLKINKLESIWLEINFPNTENFVISVWY